MTDFSGCPDVRLAVAEDIPALMDLLRAACAEDSDHTIDEEKIFDMVRRYFEKGGAIIAVIGEIGAPVASLLMVVDQIWYSPDYQIYQLSLYVDPEHRKSDKAKQLLQFSKTTSEGLSLDLTAGALSTEKTAAKVRLFQRQFKTTGAYFRYVPVSAVSDA